MNLKLTVDGEEKFAWAIDKMAKTITDFRPAWPEIEQVFYRIEQEQFDSEGARGGAKWQALSPKYAKWKALHYPGKPILVRTGRLKRSLSVIGAGGSDSIKEFEPLELVLGSRVPYGIYHQRGGGRLPKRTPININKNDMGKITSRLYRYAERGARDAGFQVQSSRLPTAGDSI